MFDTNSKHEIQVYKIELSNISLKQNDLKCIEPWI